MMLGTSEATANGAMAAVFDPSVSKTDVIKAPALAVYAGTAKPQDPKVAREVLPNYEGTQIAGTVASPAPRRLKEEAKFKPSNN